jgi:hypothetical protein
MEWFEAVDVMVTRTGHERFRWLCSEENPDEGQRDGYRYQVVAMATGTPPEPPGLFRKAVNLARATAEHVAAGLHRLSDEDSQARLNICFHCEMFRGRSCAICGCNMVEKVYWAEQRCPHPDGDRWPR